MCSATAAGGRDALFVTYITGTPISTARLSDPVRRHGANRVDHAVEITQQRSKRLISGSSVSGSRNLHWSEGLLRGSDGEPPVWDPRTPPVPWEARR